VEFSLVVLEQQDKATLEELLTLATVTLAEVVAVLAA
jgi:hypothetical protein